VLSASDVNSWFVPVTVVKPADTARNSTTSMSNDPDLVLNVAGGCTYHINGVIFYDGPAAGASDIKYTFSVPAGASGQYFMPRQNLSSSFAGAFSNFWGDTGTANTNSVGTFMILGVSGLLITTTAGALRFQWAQNTSNGTNTRVRANSFLTAQRIA
jgi:hypothetical protein